jgi:50S ribosomal protein L16 3-hydroxylase
MDVDAFLPLLGGLSPQAFMRRHWQRRPLLVRQAMPGVEPPVSRAALFALAADEAVESRLVRRHIEGGRDRWTLRRGPLPRRALPPVASPGWTLLVQGLDLQLDAAHRLLSHFRFLPQARLDDLMVSWASDGGGVGPHLDSYDVFLLQVQGRRRWRIGRVDRPAWQPDVPLKLLQDFRPDQDLLLEPGDLLYLPPGWGHDGTAEGECMTCSIGFRAPRPTELARELLLRLADALDPPEHEPLYRDAGEPATDRPGRVPHRLAEHARAAVQRALATPGAVDQSLGEWLTEPKPTVFFEPGASWPPGTGLRLDRRSRLMYDGRRLFFNGEAFLVGGRDAQLLRRLADRGFLSAREADRFSDEARAQLDDWVAAGWLQATAP